MRLIDDFEEKFREKDSGKPAGYGSFYTIARSALIFRIFFLCCTMVIHAYFWPHTYYIIELLFLAVGVLRIHAPDMYLKRQLDTISVPICLPWFCKRYIEMGILLYSYKNGIEFSQSGPFFSLVQTLICRCRQQQNITCNLLMRWRRQTSEAAEK